MPDAFDVLAALIRVDRTPNLAAAARSLAAAGVPVFPCEPDGKRPLTRRGFLDASSDPGQVAAWWARTPDANIGLPTGAASGVVVVDIDVHGSVDGRAAWRRTIDGTLRRYEITDLAAHSIGPVDAARLRDFLDPRPAPPTRNDAGAGAVDAERLAGWVAGRGEGERNRGLFWAACRLAENGTPPADTLDALGPAAARAGLSEREIATTVRSAYRATKPAPEASTSADVRRRADRWCGRSAASPVASAGRAGL